MSKYTPGPWVDFKASAGGNMETLYSQPFGIMENGGANLVAGCFGDVRGGLEVAKANARLIAKAPDMAELLNLALKVHADICEENYLGPCL